MNFTQAFFEIIDSGLVEDFPKNLQNAFDKISNLPFIKTKLLFKIQATVSLKWS